MSKSQLPLHHLDANIHIKEMDTVMIATTMQNAAMMEEIAVVIMSSQVIAPFVDVWTHGM
jgi:hypothetical protein